jgi:MFS family permease
VDRGRLRDWLVQRSDAFVQVLENRDLRRLELAFGGFYVGEWAYVVALAVYAFDQGGAVAVGLIGLLRMLPAAVAVPFAGVLADRYDRAHVLLGVHLVRAGSIGAAAAALFLDAPAVVVYALSVVAAIASAGFLPCHLALVPTLSRTPRELVAANVTSATLESIATLVGPLLAGLLLAATGPGTVFAASAGVFLVAALLVAGISPAEARGSPKTGRGRLAEYLAGVRTLAEQKDARLLIGLFAGQTLVRGFLNVLIVVVAIELMVIGDPGVGYLTAALGAGGVVGALGAVVLVDRNRLAGPFQLGLILWGAPIALIGVWPEAGFAAVCLALVGFGNSILDVSGYTLIQRSVPDAVLGRVFAVFETLAIAAIGIGAVAAAPLIAGLGTQTALIVVGAFLPLLAVIFRRRLVAIDAGAVRYAPEVELVRSLDIFAPLPLVTIEQLAAQMAPLTVPPGTELIRQGDPGDRFYVIAEGEVEIIQDGRLVAVRGGGDGVGEIALLRNVPRTATVRAATELRLYVLEGEVFVSAVSGNPLSARTADEIVASRLSAPRVPTAPL